MRGAGGDGASPAAPGWVWLCPAVLCPSRQGHVWDLASIMMHGERVNEYRKVLGCHREGAIRQDEDRATGKELPQVLDTESLAAGCNFPTAWGALTGNLKQLRQLRAQLLHDNVCNGAQDHYWPLEAGCGKKMDRLREAGG